MKKTICFALALCLLFLPVTAQAKTGQGWYFKAKGKDVRPELPQVDGTLAKGIGRDEKVVYLTFDAGYENGNVEKVLNVLKEKGVAGTFFVLEHLAKKHPELCRRMVEEGHLVGNHTANHPNVATLSPEEIKKELKEMEEVWKEATGSDIAPYFRPPEGAWSEASLKEIHALGYRTVFWSLAWADWDNNDQKSPKYAMDKLMGRMHNGAVILLHPTSATNAAILGDLIDELRREGYRFETVDTLWQSA